MSSLTDYLSKTIREQHQKIKQLEEKNVELEALISAKSEGVSRCETCEFVENENFILKDEVENYKKKLTKYYLLHVSTHFSIK